MTGPPPGVTARRRAEWPCRATVTPSAARSPNGTWGRLRAALPGAVGLSFAAVLLRWRGHLRLPMLLIAAAASLLLLGLVAPQVGRALEQVAKRASHTFGRVLAASLLGALWLVVLVPVATLNRALGLDLLEGCHTAGEWRARPDTARARSDRRPFGAEPSSVVWRLAGSHAPRSPS